MDALIVVDMQAGLLDGPPKHNLEGVITRINEIPEKVRRESGSVIWIRHCGDAGDGFARQAPGWATDLYVDATVRSTVFRNYDFVAISDAHNLSDRPHLPATTVIAHHNRLWGELLTHRSINVMSTGEFLAEGISQHGL